VAGAWRCRARHVDGIVLVYARSSEEAREAAARAWRDAGHAVRGDDVTAERFDEFPTQCDAYVTAD
jgi:hypothetical protein